jgi:molecular chaperone GrpE
MTGNIKSCGTTLEKDTNMETEKEEEEKIDENQTFSEEEKLKEKLAQSENQYLRLLADYQNLQKRTAQEKEEIYKFAAMKTIEVLMPALDTFDYAKQAIKPDSNVEKLTKDFNLVFDSLLKCLKEAGLETIEETGILFDPIYHEPIQQIPTNELPEHTVMQILKKGYILNKKVVRPAMVAVSIPAKEPSEPNQELGQG